MVCRTAFEAAPPLTDVKCPRCGSTSIKSRGHAGIIALVIILAISVPTVVTLMIMMQQMNK